MPLLTARPMKLNGTYYYRQRVPADLVHIVGTTTYKRSLGTKDPAVARRLHAQEAARAQAHWETLRRSPETLDHRQVAAVSGEVYRRVLRSDGHRGPLLGHSYGMFGGMLATALGMHPEFAPGGVGDLERLIGRHVDAVLAGRCTVDAPTRERILWEAARGALQASEQTLRECDGDWAPDAAAARFPAADVLPRLEGETSPSAENVWAKVLLNVGPKTALKYGRIFEDLLAFAGTRDTSKLTPEAVKKWRGDLLKRPGLSPRTIARDYLGAIKAILNCAVKTDCLEANPAAGISVEEARRQGPRKMRSFSDEEAATILSASLGGQAKLAAAKRWVPWLCAYTGARVNEMTQVRRGDVRRRDGEWCVVITPEAGTQKKNEAHDVPLHEHLVAQGFLEFVRGHAMGEPLFHNPRTKGVKRATFPAESTGKALAVWVRSLGVTDEAVNPNHGWRHRFKTDGRFHGLNEKVLDAIQGHAIPGMNGRYGEYPARVTSQAIAMIPRLDAEGLRHARAEDEVC